MNKLILLGASGSIGRQALDVARREGVTVEGMAVYSSVDFLDEAVRRFSPKFAVVVNPASYRDAKIKLSDTGTRILSGKEAIGEMLAEAEGDTVLNAIVGEAGLRPTVWALEAGKRLALANKESLVCAGEYVMKLASRMGQTILPVDSEHAAIHQCLRAGRREEAAELILTASGGPFFGYSKERLASVTVEETLRHPTWKMGNKITVDSATMMNKGFEMIEAAHLFSFPIEKISAVIHRESVIHSMVRFADNAVIAQMGSPDMRSCIAYALFYPERRPAASPPLDLSRLGKLTFFPPDEETFPLLSLAREAYLAGGVVPAVLNAANEEAVGLFLAKKIPFSAIPDIVSEFVHNYNTVTAPALEEIESASAEVRAVLRGRFGAKRGI